MAAMLPSWKSIHIFKNPRKWTLITPHTNFSYSVMNIHAFLTVPNFPQELK
jgi:hypothetical protein